MKKITFLVVLIILLLCVKVKALELPDNIDNYSSIEKTFITTTMEDAFGNVFEVNNIEVPQDQLDNLEELIEKEEVICVSGSCPDNSWELSKTFFSENVYIWEYIKKNVNP